MIAKRKDKLDHAWDHVDMNQKYECPRHVEYPQQTMYDRIAETAAKNPSVPAYEFYGKKTSYSQFLAKIDRAAAALSASGIKPGDRVTICLPNVPQALDFFYAIDKVGAVANMIHPMSAENEIVYYLQLSRSRMILTLDLFYEKVASAVKTAGIGTRIVISRMTDELPMPAGAVFYAKKGKELKDFPRAGEGILLKKFLAAGAGTEVQAASFEKDRTSVILYSGGTSGKPKGICLTDFNFNALVSQAVAAIGVPLYPGTRMLSCMPCFHGFGLGINLHTILACGGTCILMPTFDKKSYAKMLLKKHPQFIAGVPTIYEALLHLPELEGQDLSFLKGMFCGGDSLTIELKKKIDNFLHSHGANIQVREGYGLTECVTASCLTPRDTYKPGSIGIPFPDMDYAIVRPGTDDVLAPGEEGEIILTGPTLMLGYLDNPEETASTLKVLSDGRTWLYTGDLGTMDEEGYIFFKMRIKRMIVTNGYNVYPGQLENVIDGCDCVSYSCVIGVKDPRRMQRVRAYVVLREGADEETSRREIMEALSKNIAAYALPKEIVFRDELPRTLVGKVSFRVLEEEANREQEA